MESSDDARWVPLKDIAVSGLTADEMIAALATALSELGLACSLIMVHGSAIGGNRYAAMNRPLRFSRDGEPIVRIPAR